MWQRLSLRLALPLQRSPLTAPLTSLRTILAVVRSAPLTVHAHARAALAADLRRLQDGQRDAARAIFDALWPVLVRFARRALPDDDHAEEAAQRALIKLFAQIYRYDPTRDALSWAFAIASWEVRSLLRDHGRRAGDRPVDDIAALPSRERSVEENLIDSQTLALLDHAIAVLPELDRNTLLALLDDTQPHPPLTSALRKRRQRALERLRAMWRSFHEPP